MNEDTVRYHHARLRLRQYVAELGGSLRERDAVETTLSEDGRSVQLLFEVKPDQYAIAEFDLTSPITEEEFDETWRSQEAAHH